VPQTEDNPLIFEISLLRRFIPIAAWACLAFIVYATLVPLHWRPRLAVDEPLAVVVLERVIGYFLLGFLFSLSYPRRYGPICLLVLGGAVLLEALQVFVPDRDARPLDVIQKLAGGGMGILGACWLISVMPSRLAALVLPRSVADN
jgi:VanZ family protein